MKRSTLRRAQEAEIGRDVISSLVRLRLAAHEITARCYAILLDHSITKKSRHEPDNSSDRGHPNPNKWNTSIVLCAKIGIFLLLSLPQKLMWAKCCAVTVVSMPL